MSTHDGRNGMPQRGSNGPGTGSGGDAGYASAAAVAGLAREVEALRRAIEPLRELPARVDELADLVARLAETTAAAGTSRPAPAAAPSWLALPAEVRTAHLVLTELTGWMGGVFLRYPDAAASLPECWLWHPDLVEELLWLMHAWLAAYRDETATVQLAGDWHDRQRPGVVRRIRAVAGTCSLDNHPPRDSRPTGAPVPLGAAAAELIATWWATARDQPAPEPTDEHLTATLTRRSPGARR